MGKYDYLIPKSNQQPSTPATIQGAVFGMSENKPVDQITPSTIQEQSNKYSYLIPKKQNTSVQPVSVSSTTITPSVSQQTPTIGGKYSHLLPKPKNSNYFAVVDAIGNSIGFSDAESDPSGRAYLAYRKPGDTATTTDYTRVATKFDPRTPTKVTRDDFYNPRAVENRVALRKAMGGAYNDELDHKIAVALSGSNNIKNLRPEPASENTDSSVISRLQKEVITGTKSLFEAQVELARIKGIDIPWTPEVKKQAEADRFGRFLGNLQEYVVKPKTIDLNALPKGEKIGPANPNNKKVSGVEALDKFNTPTFDPASTAGIVTNTIKGIPAATGEFAKDVAQGVARTVGTVGVTAQRAFAKGMRSAGVNLPELPAQIDTNNNKYAKFLFGGKPIQDLPTFARTATKATEDIASRIAGKDVKLPNAAVGYPLAVGSILLDLTGWGGKAGVKSFVEGEVPEKFLKYVAKTNNPAVLEKTYTKIGVTDPALAKALANATKDAKTVDEVKQVLIDFGKTKTDTVKSIESNIPNTARVWIKSKFSPGEGQYKDIPIIRKEENITLYQGGNDEQRQFWTPDKKYAAQFGDVKEKTGSFYKVDNGNRMTDVYVDADKIDKAVVDKPRTPQQILQEFDANKNGVIDPGEMTKTRVDLPAKAKKYKTADEFIDSLDLTAQSKAHTELQPLAKDIDIKEFGTSIRTPDVEYGVKTNPEAVQAWEKKIQSGDKPIVYVGGDFSRVVDGANRLQAYKNLGYSKIPTVFESQLKDIWKETNQQTKPTLLRGPVTTTILEKIADRPSVSKQFILDLTNSGDIKQNERDLIREVLSTEGNKVDVPAFIKKVEAELLPLKVKGTSVGSSMVNEDDYNEFFDAPDTKYESVVLPDKVRGKIKDYSENIYESPIKTSAGDKHFSGDTQNYFGHTRIEDMADNKTRRVIEVQSDLYQKGNLEREYNIGFYKNMEVGNINPDIARRIPEGEELIKLDKLVGTEGKRNLPAKTVKRWEELSEKAFTTTKEARSKEVAKLQQYTNPTAHFRMVREEVKRAAQDSKEKLLFPTGETAMKIEGLGQNNQWYTGEPRDYITQNIKLEPDKLKVGEGIFTGYGNDGDHWIITDVLGDGRFKAIPKDQLDFMSEGFSNLGLNGPDDTISAIAKGDKMVHDVINTAKETFDISGKIDTNNPIYRFYEKDLGRYLTNKYDARLVTDNKGVSWYEVKVDKSLAEKPVVAFKKLNKKEATDIYESTIGKEIRFNSSEADIDRVFRRIFNPGEIRVSGDSKLDVAGNYTRMRDEKGILRHHINLLTVDGLIAKDVALHEAGHAVFNMFKTPEYRKALLNRIKKMGLLTNYKKYKSYETDDLKAEEWLMDDFADFWNAKYGGPKYKGFFGALWEKFSQFLKDLVRKFTKADKLYEDIINKRRPTGGTVEEKSVKLKIRNQEINKPPKATESSTARATRNTDVTPAMRERIANNEAEMANKRRKEVPEYRPRGAAPTTPKIVEGLFDSFKGALNPLRAVDKKTSDTFHQWNSDIILGKERVRQEIQDVSQNVPSGMKEIHEYEAGDGKNREYIQKLFDDLQKEANDRGIEVGYVENYIPHVYANNAKEQEQKILKFLEGKGLTEEEARAYMNEQPLKPDVSARLKLSPRFDKERIFKSYVEAESIGLIPKYTSVADLAGYYVSEMEKVVANRKMLDTLWDAGKIKPDVSAPTSWSILNAQFSPNSTFKAPAQVARVINGIFPDTNIPSFGRNLMAVTSSLSKKLQNVTLSAGIPFTNFNYFSLGQMIKEVTSGNMSAAKAWIRANSDTFSERYFEEKKPIIRLMGYEGIDLSGRLGRNGERAFNDFVRSKEWTKAFGKGFDEAFSSKTFGSFMPQLYIGVFDNVYTKAIARGMNEVEARKLAGDTVKNNFGLLSDDFARSKIVKDTLSTLFFAPQFREGVIRTLTKTGMAGFNFARAALKGGKSNPAYRKNLQLLAGMAISFALYQAINKQTTGTYTWENPDGRRFAIRIPMKDGDVAYIEYMPSFFAFPRMIATGAMAAAEGDIKLATQKFGGLLSSPVKLITDVIGNEDYFGREIYKDTDETSVKAKKIAEYLGLNATHPYIREIVNQINDKNPLYQSVSAVLELPLKFSSQSKETKSAIIKEQQAKTAEEARARNKFMPKYNEIQDLFKQNEESGQRALDNLTDEEYELYKSVSKIMKTKDTRKYNLETGGAIYKKVQQMERGGEDVMPYIESLTDDEYKAYKSVKNSLE